VGSARQVCANLLPAMPKKRPSDAPPEVLAFLRKIAAKGGKRGGVARWKGVSAEERSRQMRALRARPVKKR
jgi:hypothetical protein